MALPWREVVKKKRYQGLSPDDRRNAQDEYFNQTVANRLEDPGEIRDAHREFLSFAADLDKGAAPPRRAATPRRRTPAPQTRARTRARGKPSRPTSLAQVDLPGAELRAAPTTKPSLIGRGLEALGFDLPEKRTAPHEAAAATVELAAKEEGVSLEEFRAPSTREQALEDIVGQAGKEFLESATLGLPSRIAEELTGQKLPMPGEARTTAGEIAGGLGGLAGFIKGPAGAVAHGAGAIISKVLPQATRTGKIIPRTVLAALKEAGSLAAGMTALNAGEILDSKDLDEAGGKLWEAASGGAALGATFGVARGVFPGKGLGQRLGRIAGGIALLDLMHGSRPWDDRELAQKTFDYGLDVFFLLNGLPERANKPAFLEKIKRSINEGKIPKELSKPPSDAAIDKTINVLMDQTGVPPEDALRGETTAKPLQEKIAIAKELATQLGFPVGEVAPSGLPFPPEAFRGELERSVVPEGELPTAEQRAIERTLDISERPETGTLLPTAEEAGLKRAGIRPSRRRPQGLEGIPIVEGASEPLIYMMEGRPAEAPPKPDVLPTAQELAMQRQGLAGLVPPEGKAPRVAREEALREEAPPQGPPLSPAGIPLVQGLEQLEQPEARRPPPPTQPSELKQPPPLSATERLHPSVEGEVAPTPERVPRVGEEVKVQRAEDRQSFIDEIGREPKGAEKALLRRGAVEKAIEYGRRKVPKAEFEQERERSRVARLEEEAETGEPPVREEAPEPVAPPKEVEPTAEPAPLEGKKEAAPWEKVSGGRVRFNPPETRTEAGPSFGIEIQQSGAGRIPTKTLEDAGFEWDNFGKTWHAEDTKKTRAFVESLPVEVPPETPVPSEPALPRTRFDEIKEARAERLEERAEKAEQKAEAGFKRSADILDIIPAGQPVLKGHPSEARHRRDLAKADRGARTGVEESKKAEELRRAAEKARTGKAVSSADPNAISKLEEKLATLETKQARMKEINAEFKKKKGKIGEMDLSPAEKKEILDNFKFSPGGTTKPFPSYALTNNSAGIQNVKKRIEVLGATAEKPAETIELPGLTIDITKDPIGIDLHYTEKPSEETRAQIKQGGFRWASSRKVWHAKDNPRSRAVIDQLRKTEETTPVTPAPTGEAASRIIDTLKGQEGAVDFQTKAGRQIFSDLVDVGREVITQGKRSYKEFTATFKERMGKHWDKVKGVVRRVWAAARKPLPGVIGPGERGEVGRRRKPPAGVRVAEPRQLNEQEVQELRDVLRGVTERARPGTKYARPSSINLERRIPEGREDLEQLTDFMAKTSPRKKQSWDETGVLSEEILSDFKKTQELMAKAEEGQNLNAQELMALNQIYVNNVARVAEMTKDTSLNNEELGQQLKKFSENIFTTTSDANSSAGLALNILRQTAVLGRMGRVIANLERDLNERELQEWRTLVESGALEKINEEDPVQVAEAAARIKAFTERLGDPTLMDYVYEFLYNNMLSGPPTHAVNAGGNTLWGTFQFPHRVLEGGVDLVIAKLRGRPQRVFMSEVVPMLAGYKKGLKRGRGPALEVLKTGELLELETKWAQEMGPNVIGAMSRSPSATIRKLGSGLKIPGTEVPVGLTTPTRALRVMDVWANAAGYDAQMGALALRAGKKQGLKGESLESFQNEFLLDPPKEATQEAAEFARYATFMDEPGVISRTFLRAREEIVIDVQAKIPKWVPLVGGARVGKIKPVWFVIPFVRTIGNLLKRGIEMTPLAGVGLARGQTPASVIAKQIEGAAIMMVVLSMIEDDRITGPLPEGKNERAAWHRQKKKPWSLKPDKTWIQYRRVEPFNTVIASIVIAHKKMFNAKDEDTATEIFMNTAKGVKDNLIDSAYMQGVQRILDRHGQTKGMLQRQAATFVPFSSFWRSINRAFEVATEGETKVRETKSLLGAFSQVIPGLSGKMPPRLNVWGEEIVLPGGIFRQWLPIKWAKETDDPVEKVLEKIGVYPGLPGKHVAIKGVRTELDDDIYRSYLKSYGSKAKRLLGKRVKLLNRIKDPLVAQKLVDKMLRQVRGVELRRAKRKQLLKDRREKQKAKKG